MPLRKTLLAALLPVVLAPAACSAESPARPATTATAAAPHPSAVAPAAPAEPTDCGDVVLLQGGEVPAETTACFLDAVRDKRPAVLKVTRPTVEGDPIRYAYTALPDGRVEVVTDARADGFGSGRMFRETCTGPVAGGTALTFAACSSPVRIG